MCIGVSMVSSALASIYISLKLFSNKYLAVGRKYRLVLYNFGNSTITEDVPCTTGMSEDVAGISGLFHQFFFDGLVYRFI